MAGTNGPWWSFTPGSDTPAQYEPDDSMENGPRMLASALLLMALVVVLFGLACRAWAIEDDATAARVRATVQQMEGR